MSDSAMHTLTRLTLESLQVFNRTSARVRRAARGIRKRNVVSHVAPIVPRNGSIRCFDDSHIKLYSQTKLHGPVAWGGRGRCYGPDASWTSVSLLDLASLRLGQAAHGAEPWSPGTGPRDAPILEKNPNSTKTQGI
jgi:hypothetical protein